MKKKLLSLLLVIAIMVTSVSMGFGAIGAFAAGSQDAGVSFSVQNKQATGSSPSTNLVATVGNGYKVRIKSVTPTVINSSLGTASVSVSYTENSTVLTNGEKMAVSISGVGSNANTAIRYKITYDILDSSGNAVWTDKVNYAYGVVSQNGAVTGAVGGDNTTPGNHVGRYEYWYSFGTIYSYFDPINMPAKNYVQTTSGSYECKVTTYNGGSLSCNCYKSHTRKASISNKSSDNLSVSTSEYTIPHHNRTWSSDSKYKTVGPYTWLSWSVSKSGYYSFDYTINNGEDGNLTNNTGSVKVYYLTEVDKNTATTALEGCANLQADNYTAASWAALEAAMDKAAQVAYAVQGANEGYKFACQNGASAASAVNDAKSKLVYRKANWDATFDAYVAAFKDENGKKVIIGNEVTVYTYVAGDTTYGKINVDKYEKSAADAFLAWSDEPLNHYVNDDDPTDSDPEQIGDIYRYDQHLVDAYEKKIINDRANLPLADAVYTYLDIAIKEYNTKNKDYYYADAWNAYEKAVNEAKELPRDGKTDYQETINKSLVDIIEKKVQLEYNLQPANTTALYVQIGEAVDIYDQYNEGNLLVTMPGFSDVWNEFETKYNEAMAAKNATIDKQGEVNRITTELKNIIATLARFRVLDVTELSKACGLKIKEEDIPKYTPESYNLWYTLRLEGYAFIDKATPNDDGIVEKTYADYEEMKSLAYVIQNAYENLEKVKADFTELNYAVSRIPSDDVLALYEEKYVDDIKSIVATINYGATIDEQESVDKITEKLNAALAELNPDNYKGANYDDVDAAIAEAEELKDIVTNYAIVQNEIDKVNRNKKIVEQAEVDAMAAAIREAIGKFEYIGADYSDVIEAIKEANAVENQDWYANYYKVTEAVNAVVEGKTIREQAEVDAMATAIREAIANLKLADADYSGIREAIAEYNALAPFTDFYSDTVSAVDNAIAEVKYGLKADEQYRVDAWQEAIEKAIDGMKLLPADYSNLYVAKNYAESLDPKKYTNYNEVEKAIEDINWELNCRQGAEMRAQIAAINNAVANLELLPADYSKVDEAIENARKFYQDSEYPYTPESIQELEDVIANIDRTIKIDKQADVDAYITKIQIAVTKLTYVRADYSALDELRAEYDNLQRELYASLSAVDAYVAKIDWNKTIDKQVDVDKYVTELDAMLRALEYAPADYTAVDNAIVIFNAMNHNYYEQYDVDEVRIIINSVERDLKKNEQDRVNQMAQNINNAIAELRTKMKKADLADLSEAVTQAMAKYNEMSATGYAIDPATSGPLELLLVRAGDFNADTTIDKQSEIDETTANIIEATANLEFVFTLILDGTNLVIKDGYMYGFEEGTTSAIAKSLIKFVGAAEIKITETKNGFGTGAIVQFISTKDGSVIATYTVLVFGDANGDAVIDMFDVAYIVELVNEGSQPADMILRVLDITNDGYLDPLDVTVMIGLANMDATLEQDGSMRTY